MTSVQPPVSPPAASRDGGIGRGVQVAIAAVVLAVIAVTLLGVVMQRLSSRTDSVNAQAAAANLAGPTARAAETAAITAVRATLTYNYKTLQADFANAARGLTPTFRSSYLHTTATSVAPLAKKYSAVSTAEISAAGVSSASANAATVLLFANQTVQNTQLAHPRLDRTRIKVSMVKVGGKWLVNNLTPL